MKKQCGNCRWWDMQRVFKTCLGELRSNCNAAIPVSIIHVDKYTMPEKSGKDCPIFEEIKP